MSGVGELANAAAEEPRKRGRKQGSKTPGRQLLDMRYVYRHPEPKDGERERPIRVTLRKLLAENPERFLARLTALEKEEREKRAADQPKGEKAADAKVEAVDAGSRRCRELIERLLSEWEAGPPR